MMSIMTLKGESASKKRKENTEKKERGGGSGAKAQTSVSRRYESEEEMTMKVFIPAGFMVIGLVRPFRIRLGTYEDRLVGLYYSTGPPSCWGWSV